jgi:elongation factor G
LHAFRSISSNTDIQSVRNVGIVAHIDAGKTTTTENMLFLTGETKSVGRVDTGDTVTDFLPMERDRGITIQSAAISMEWKGCEITLIDTPGHVDFTIEVERAARVIDGAVVVLESVSGVQAQTRTVWRQIRKKNVPAVAFVNKMDRVGADFASAVDSIRSKLQANAVPLHLPIFRDDDFIGVVDLINMQKTIWGDPVVTLQSKATKGLATVADSGSITAADDVFEDAVAARNLLLESLSEHDDELMEKYLLSIDDCESANAEVSGDSSFQDSFTQDELLQSIRRCCLRGLIVPTLCGASLRGKGVDMLLDAVGAFLPSPVDAPAVSAIDKETGRTRAIEVGKSDTRKDFCGLAFKVQVHPSRGNMVFVRSYSGALGPKMVLLNTTRGIKERATQVLFHQL